MPNPPSALTVVLLLPLAAITAPRPKDTPEERLCFPTAVGTTWVYLTRIGECQEVIAEAKTDGKATIVTVVRMECGVET